MFGLLQNKIDYPIHQLLGFRFEDLALKSLLRVTNGYKLIFVSELFTESISKLSISLRENGTDRVTSISILSKIKVELDELLHKHNIDTTLDYSLTYRLNEEDLNTIKTSIEELNSLNNRYLFFDSQAALKAEDIKDIIFDLQMKSLQPIIVFPEFNSYWNTHRSRLERLHTRGVMFQINWLSLTGFHGKDAQYTARYLLERKAVKFIGFENENLGQLISKSGIKIPKRCADLLEEQLFV